MFFFYVKALHIIFVVTWFAGLFYMVRLFVYFAETEVLAEPEKSILRKQYQLMQRRLWYGIAWPSAVMTLILGLTLVYFYGDIPAWLWVKLAFVVFLYAYHFSCHLIFRQHQLGVVKYTSNQLRIYNEVATLFLFAIVFLVVLKDSFSWVYGLLILSALVLVLMAGIKIYKRVREK
jgi:protoporphyrinogen IX oxidase